MTDLMQRSKQRRSFYVKLIRRHFYRAILCSARLFCGESFVRPSVYARLSVRDAGVPWS